MGGPPGPVLKFHIKPKLNERNYSMIKTSVLRYAAIGMATISMAGFAAASTVTFDTTGPHSNQSVHINNNARMDVNNNNNLKVTNANSQMAKTGNVDAHDNTSVSGDLYSGAASNGNTNGTTLKVDNGGSGAASFSMAPADDSVSIALTGPHSNNNVTIDNNRNMSVSNHNEITVSNTSYQTATSGNVKASENTTVGGLSSGDASNTNSTTTSVDISN